MNYKTASCIKYSATTKYLSSCLLTPQNPIVPTQQVETLTANVNQSSEISSVSFSPSNNNASVSPSSDTTYTYNTDVTGQIVGTSVVTATVRDTAGASACTSTSLITIVPPSAWWQVIDADVQTNGDLKSSVPINKFFGLPGPGGFPGVPGYGTSTNLTSAKVAASPYNWIAQSQWTDPKQFNYNFFVNQIPSDVIQNNLKIITSATDIVNKTGTPDINGYEWYEYDGTSNGGLPLTIDSPISIGTRKIIVLVGNTDLNISSDINGVEKGKGYFMAIVNGNIVVSPSVGGGASPNLEGIYVADGYFADGTLAPSVDAQLWARGTIVAYGGVSLTRDLKDADNTTPANVFEYAPDQILLMPSSFKYRKINWKEIAP